MIMMVLCIGQNILTVKIFLLLYLDTASKSCMRSAMSWARFSAWPLSDLHGEAVSAGSVVTFKSLILSPSLTAAWTMTVCG